MAVVEHSPVSHFRRISSATPSFVLKFLHGFISIEFHEYGHHSIAHETLYNFAFESVAIGRSVGAQIGDKVPGARAIWRDFGVQTEFPAERFVSSNPTQKTSDRARQALSNDVFIHSIRLN